MMTENLYILIVDDDKLMRWGLEKAVSGRNHIVTSVSNGTDALLEIRAMHYHWVFLDINLPDLNGFEVLREIVRTSPETIVIVITADNTEDNRQKAMTGGAFGFIGKPFGIPEIREVMESGRRTRADEARQTDIRTPGT